MSKLFKKRKSVQPDAVKYCFQANNDQMLFFEEREEMNRYLLDYRKRLPIYNLIMFRVEFYKEIK